MRAQQSHTVTAIGNLGGNFSAAYGINNSSQVVGMSYTTTGAQHGFVYSGGTITDLEQAGSNQYSYAYGVNDSGQIAGDRGSHAFSSSGGSATDLGTLRSGNAGYSHATAISATGNIVGYADTGAGSGTERAFSYANGTMASLGDLGDSSFAMGVNAAGQAVGYGFGTVLGQYGTYALLFSGGSVTPIGRGKAFAINATGQIVGGFNASNHAFSYLNGTLTDLGTIGSASSAAYAINASGQIVGSIYNNTGFEHAFIFQNGTMFDLSTGVSLAGTDLVGLTRATSINDAGQIVGYGVNSTGGTEAFLLTPTAIPEPAAYAALAGLCALGFARLRRLHRPA